MKCKSQAWITRAPPGWMKMLQSLNFKVRIVHLFSQGFFPRIFFHIKVLGFKIQLCIFQTYNAHLMNIVYMYMITGCMVIRTIMSWIQTINNLPLCMYAYQSNNSSYLLCTIQYLNFQLEIKPWSFVEIHHRNMCVLNSLKFFKIYLKILMAKVIKFPYCAQSCKL